MRWRCILLALTIKTISARLDFSEDLNTLVDDITKNYFQEFKCVIYITDDNGKFTPNWTLLPSVITVTLNRSTETLLQEIYDIDCNGFILRVMDRIILTKNLVGAYKKSIIGRYNNKRYLFLPVNESDSSSNFLEMEEMYYMPDLIFVAPADDLKHFEVVVHNYFNGHKYDVLNVKMEIINVWYPGVGFERNETLYWNRLGNLYGKKMIFALTHYAPYALVIREDDDIVYDGLETRLAAQLADLANATWTGKDHPVHLWGDILENGSMNGIIGSVYEHSADFGFAAIYQWHCDILDCSYPYIYAGITCLVPKPLPLSGAYTFILPFKPAVWGVILLTYLFSSLFVFFATIFIQRTRRAKSSRESLLKVIQESLFIIFRIQIEQSPRQRGEGTPLFGFFRICTVYAFFVALCWQGGIASFLTVPGYETPINDAQDLVSRWPKVEWGANHIDWTKSIKESTDPLLTAVVRKFVVLDDETLKKRMKMRNFGYFMEQLPNGHYGINSYIDEEGMQYLRKMEKNIYTANCVIILPKCSPYLEALDKMLFWMFDTGLIQKMEIQISLERINNRLQNMIRTSTETSSQKDTALLINHILGALFIYAFGITLSALVFLFEIFYYYTFRKENKFNLL